MQPDLALLYHSRAGNGQLGVGWSLSGLSAITRCPALRDQEGVAHTGGVTLSAEDRFCLDGQPLRRQSGTYGASGVVYLTEVQSFQKVTSHGNINGAPTHFTVTGLDGLTRSYGNTTDSRILSVGVTAGVPIVWALNRIEDKFGNYISFSYGFDAVLGEYWPSEIRWANNTGVVLGRVEFTYNTSRNDKTFGYAYGRTRQSLTRRLEHIQVYEGTSNPVRRYKLTYISSTGGTGAAGSPLSYLYTLEECAGTGSPCLAPTEFLRSVGWRGVSSISPQTIAGDFSDLKWLDVNGDGRPDGVGANNGTLRLYFAKDGGQQTPTNVQTSAVALKHGVVLDYNGDGLMDLLVPNTVTGYWNVLRSTGDSMVLETTPHLHYNAHNKDPVAFDFTGNGMADLLFRRNGTLWMYRGADNGGFVAGALATGFTVSSGQQFHPLQFNGDGRADLMISMDDCTTYVPPPPPDCPPDQSCEINSIPGNEEGEAESGAAGDSGTLESLEPYSGGGATINAAPTSFCYQSAGVYRWDPAAPLNDALVGPYHPGAQGLNKLRLLDIDGDGLTDVVGLIGSGQVQVYLNRGGHFEAQTPTVPPGPNWDKALVFDYNLDGREDVLIHQSSGTFQLLTFASNAVVTTNTFISSTQNKYQVADWNGDGLPDLLVFTGSQWRMWRHQGEKEGLLLRVRNGLGDELSIKHSAISRAGSYALYEGHEPSDAPTNTPRVRNFQGPIFVVESFAADTGINTSGGIPEKVVTQYRYAGAKLNTYGRGFLGFRRVTAFNQNTGIETINVHFQEFPWTGMVKDAVRKVPDVTTIEYIDPPVCPPMPAECPVPPPIQTTTPGPVISETTNTVGVKVLGTAGIGRVRFPFVSNSTEKTFEFAGGGSAMVKQTSTAYTYDNNGNPTQIVATINNGSGGDQHTVTTVNSWSHDDTCPARLDQSTVTHISPAAGSAGETNISRTAVFTYDLGFHCQILTEVSNAGTPAALTKTYTYDGFGNRRTETVTGTGISPARTTTTVFDAKGRYPQTITNALGHTLTVNEWHEAFGVRKRVTDANGLLSQWEIDVFGRETKAIAPRIAQFVTSAYEWCGPSGCRHPEAVLKVTRTGNGDASEQSQTISEIDRLGREVAAAQRNVQGHLVYALTFYDAAGRPYANSGPYRPGIDTGACWTLRHYDLLGRVRKEYASALPDDCISLAAPPTWAAPAGWSLTQTSYSGLTTTVVDPEGRQRQSIVNVMDRLRFVREHDGVAWRETEYRHDAVGNVAWVQAPGGAQISSSFDSAGRKTAMSDPSMGNWSYLYNAAGELTSQSDPNNNTVTMTYDALGRIKTRTEPEGTTTWTYDNTAHGPARGKVTDITGLHGYRERFWYDATGGELMHYARFIGDTWFWTRYDYNLLGQVSQIRYPSVNCAAPCSSSPADAGRLRVDQLYRHGHLYQVRERRPDGTAGTIYWEALEVDALGSVTREQLGNNLFTQRVVNPATGLLESIYTGTSGDSTSIQDLSMLWDRAGNLTRRTDHKVDRREDLVYDPLGRLTSVTLKTAAGSVLGNESMAYAPSGNLTSKGSYTNYQYGHTGRPHQVSAVTTPGGTRSYAYDPNGNLTAVTGPAARTVTWWSFNKPRKLERDANNSAEYWYGPGGDRAMFRQSARVNGQIELILYGALLYERRHIGAAVTHVHYIQANGSTVATVHRSGTSPDNTHRYLHKDHLGSVVAITSQAGVIEERLAYDAWGKRRPWNTWQTPNPGVFIAAITLTRGFTLHEHLDQVGLIHMGGRVYDPEIGRFLSADPFVQFPASTQGFNRYSYVSNNPLSYTDPSGYFLKKLARIAGIAMYFVPGMQLSNLWLNGLVAGFLSSGGNLQAGLMSMMSAGLTSHLNSLQGLNTLTRGLAQGVVQGGLAKAGGGRFGDGALGGMAGSLGGHLAQSARTHIGRTIAAAAVGGTASRLGGGKFANGAATAALAQALGEAQNAARERRAFSAVATVEEISVADARALYDDVIDAIKATGEDVSNIRFDEGYGVRMRDGTYQGVDDFAEYQRIIASGKGQQVGGVWDPKSDQIVIFRSAFSGTVHRLPVGPFGRPQPVNYRAGFQGGAFVVGHELGHRAYGGGSETAAHRYGMSLVDRVCKADPRC